MILRPAENRDFEGILELIQNAHLGLTTIPKDAAALMTTIKDSVSSFAKEVTTPGDENYLFVLEEESQRKVIGISAIRATTGNKEPLYFFRKEMEKQSSPASDVVHEHAVLNPVSYVRGPSELCTLFLHPDVRHKGVGKLLSYGRLLFVAKHIERFTNSFFAELRGVIIDDHSPFWDAVGSHFLQNSYQETQERLKKSRDFIKDFLPHFPIYIDLIDKKAQDVIGKTHPHTEGALRLLLQQGFHVSDEVDIFDAGPKLEGIRGELSAVAKSRIVIVDAIVDHIESEKLYLFSNDRLQDFRATLGTCRLEGGKVTLSHDIAEALQVSLHNAIRLYEVQT